MCMYPEQPESESCIYEFKDLEFHDNALIKEGMDFFDALDVNHIWVSEIKKRFRGIDVVDNQISFGQFVSIIVCRTVQTYL